MPTAHLPTVWTGRGGGVGETVGSKFMKGKGARPCAVRSKLNQFENVWDGGWAGLGFGMIGGPCMVRQR